MDFKSVVEYNSAVHKICSKLRFCDQQVNDADKNEKTLSTFLPANRLLQQQYRHHNYVKYPDLIYHQLQAEKHDELLTKNHQMRPVGASPLPEIHYNSQNTQKKFSGKKFKKIKGKWNNKNKHHYQKSKDSHKGKGTSKKNFHHDNSQVCRRCGCHRNATLLSIWLNSTRNLLANMLKGISMKHTLLLNLLTPVAPRMLLWKIMMRRSLRR
jgi:hypothetical protein